MSSVTVRSRMYYVAAALALVAGASTGGGESARSESGSSTVPDVATAAADAYPVTITHRLGEAVLEAPPQRIVTLGYGDEDAVAALGVIPVGSLSYDVGTFSPWFESARGAAEVVPIDVIDGFPMEQVAGLDPDLIVVMGNDVTGPDYRLLDAIAPTIAYQNEPFLDAWQDVTRTLGDALGVPDRAEQLVADTEAAVVDAAATHPEWAGMTFAVAVIMSPDEIGVLVSPEENTVRLLTDLGMQLAPAVAELELGPTGFSTFISRERLDVLDADVLVVREGGPDVRAAMEADPLFTALQVWQDGNVVWADADMWSAFRSPSVLAIPYALERLVPQLEEARP